MLGTGVYDFNITLKNVTGNLLEVSGIKYSYGINSANYEQVILVKRLGVVNIEGNSTKVTLEVTLCD